MPTYVYRREDGTTFEIEQRITADALETCPTTGQPVKRIISGGTGLIFKGSGFYQTDYVNKKDDASPKKETPSDKATEKSTTSSEKNTTPAASKSDD